ncbi:MAG TPA: YceI family protein [Candidatus Krumholzibacteria bacterium]|nr:YceI family protein [Candidatus Krumholzibacteria bacterium]HRX51824.1 YceI family protein [Candidatus Krumholzibacteria bacterium]
MRKILLLTALAALLTAGAAQAATYAIDASHSSVSFKVRHMMVSKVKGFFEDFEGTIEFDETNMKSAKVNAVIQMASVNTNDEKRDGHLRNEDFFDVAKYPTMTFTSTGVKQDGDDWLLMGDLTMHGVTKPVTLELEYNGTVEDPWGNTRVGFSAEGEIDRTEFGIVYNSTLDKGGLAVGNEVEIMLEIEAIKK